MASRRAPSTRACGRSPGMLLSLELRFHVPLFLTAPSNGTRFARAGGDTVGSLLSRVPFRCGFHDESPHNGYGEPRRFLFWGRYGAERTVLDPRT